MLLHRLIFKILVLILFWSVSHGIISVQEYCDKFDNYNVKPLVCFLRVNNATLSTTQIPPEEEWESDEDPSCSCDVNCYPGDDSVIDIDLEPLNISIRQTLPPANLKCQPCGKSCPVNSYLTSRCSCVAVGPSTSTTGPKCQCSVTCASPDHHSGEDPFCIYNVTRISKLLGVWNPYSCECDKSRAAQNSPFPEFTCICQPD